MKRSISLEDSPLTAIDNHAGVPTFLASASLAILSYTDLMFFGAPTAPGRANGALIRLLSDGESFDMVYVRFVMSVTL